MWPGHPLLDQIALSLQVVLKIDALSFGPTKVPVGLLKLCIHLTMLFGTSAGRYPETCSPFPVATTKSPYGKKTFKETGIVFLMLVVKQERKVEHDFY